MLERGVFDDIDMSMMVHTVQDGVSWNPTGTTCQAVGRYRATFHGKASHAAAAPHLAVNAADAAVLSQVAIGLLRQQIPSDHRVACFVAQAGHVTNIIPDLAVVEFECRAFTMLAYESLLERVRHCFEAGAVATGCDLEITATEPVYEPLEQDEVLCRRWVEAVSMFGHDMSTTAPLEGGSTDMGNVSRRLPSIHPWLSIPGAKVGIHSHDYAAVANTDAAYDVMFEGALGMAWTIQAVARSSEDLSSLALTRAARRSGSPG